MAEIYDKKAVTCEKLREAGCGAPTKSLKYIKNNSRKDVTL